MRMLISAASVLAASMIATLPKPAVALAIRAECAAMIDRIGCTCALDNGGYVENGHWHKGRGGSDRGDRRDSGEPRRIDAFSGCVSAAQPKYDPKLR